MTKLTCGISSRLSDTFCYSSRRESIPSTSAGDPLVPGIVHTWNSAAALHCQLYYPE